MTRHHTLGRSPGRARALPTARTPLVTGAGLSMLALLAACATAGSTRGALERSEVDVPPELLGCSMYAPPQPPPNDEIGVTLTFVVGEDGWVEEESVTPRIGAVDSTNPALIERAVSDARSCRYSPGYVAGNPVRVKLIRRFLYDA